MAAGMTDDDDASHNNGTTGMSVSVPAAAASSTVGVLLETVGALLVIVGARVPILGLEVVGRVIGAMTGPAEGTTLWGLPVVGLATSSGLALGVTSGIVETKIVGIVVVFPGWPCVSVSLLGGAWEADVVVPLGLLDPVVPVIAVVFTVVILLFRSGTMATVSLTSTLCMLFLRLVLQPAARNIASARRRNKNRRVPTMREEKEESMTINYLSRHISSLRSAACQRLYRMIERLLR